MSAKFKFLKDPYADDGDREEILKSSDTLESKEMYPDMENLALEAAPYYYNEIIRKFCIFLSENVGHPKDNRKGRDKF
ncbi:hypothetical protein [Bacillus gobiensis]|uniref:hypothetical protein n=1 Tax=Bacillus gobiensis TaxID=1441095 RepID=UPI003D1BD8F5